MRLSSLLAAVMLSTTIFYGVADVFYGTPNSISKGMAAYPQGSAVASLNQVSRNRGACDGADSFAGCL